MCHAPNTESSCHTSHNRAESSLGCIRKIDFDSWRESWELKWAFKLNWKLNLFAYVTFSLSIAKDVIITSVAIWAFPPSITFAMVCHTLPVIFAITRTIRFFWEIRVWNQRHKTANNLNFETNLLRVNNKTKSNRSLDAPHSITCHFCHRSTTWFRHALRKYLAPGHTLAFQSIVMQ